MRMDIRAFGSCVVFKKVCEAAHSVISHIEHIPNLSVLLL